MDIPRLLAMSRYWQSHPPLHIMVAGYLGIQPIKRSIAPENHQNTPESLNEFAQIFAAFGGGVN